MPAARPSCHYCHWLLTFPEEQQAEKVRVTKNGKAEILYFHPTCYKYFLRFVSSVFTRIMRGLEINPDVEKFEDIFQAQNEIEKRMEMVLQKFKHQRFSARAAKIYDLWLLSVRYLRYQPELHPKILEELDKLSEVAKLTKLRGPP